MMPPFPSELPVPAFNTKWNTVVEAPEPNRTNRGFVPTFCIAHDVRAGFAANAVAPVCIDGTFVFCVL